MRRCKHGHVLTPENLCGGRCRVCARDRQRRWRARNPEYDRLYYEMEMDSPEGRWRERSKNIRKRLKADRVSRAPDGRLKDLVFGELGRNVGQV